MVVRRAAMVAAELEPLESEDALATPCGEQRCRAADAPQPHDGDIGVKPSDPASGTGVLRPPIPHPP